ncbi:uncharacterized protein O3C94_018928 [Discoglossus pictus]
MSHNQVTEVVRLQAETQMEPGHIGESTADIQGNEIVLHSVDSSANRGDNAYSEEITYAHCIWSAEYSDPDTRQEEMFRRLQSEVLENVSQGYNSCILSYKQTGSGKPFTLMGTDGQPGLIPGICSSLLNKDLYKPKSFQVEVSYMDIWNDEVTDLLQPRGDMMAPSDDQMWGSNVMGVSQYAVSDFEDITFLMGYGAGNECPSNRGSRQSHTIFTITVTVTDSHPTSESRGLLSKVILVDLADDETAFNPGQHKITPENHPTLESVVYYLTEKSKQKINCKCMPYQECLLTRILQESLGGDCSTMLLAIITPTVNNYTCGTLRLNVTGKEIRNRQVVNKKMNTVHGQKSKLEKQMQWLEELRKDMYCPWDTKLKKTETAIQDRQKTQINPTTDHSESAQIAGPERHSGAGSSEMEVEADSSDRQSRASSSVCKAEAESSERQSGANSSERKSSAEASDNQPRAESAVSKVGTDSTESQPRTETSVTKAGTDSSESQSRAESSVFKAGTDYSESQPRAESSVSKAGTDTTESQPRAKSSVFKAGTDSSESQPRAESSVFKAGTDSSESQPIAETSVSTAGTDSSESQCRAETSVSKAGTDSTESQRRAESSVSKAGTDSSESQSRAESSVSKAGTDSTECQPRAETSVSKAGTDSSESQSRAESSVSKAGTVSSESQPRAETSVTKTGTDSSESQPRAETSASNAWTDSSESQLRAETSVSKAGTDSTESQPRAETSVSKARTDSTESQRRAESSVSKAGTDFSKSQPRAESSVSKAGTDSSKSQPRAESSVSTAGTDSSESQPRAETSVTGKEIRNRQVENEKINTVHGQKRKLEKQMEWFDQLHKEMYCSWDKKPKKTKTAIQDRQKAQINPTTDHSESAQIAGPERHSGAGSSEMEVEAYSSERQFGANSSERKSSAEASDNQPRAESAVSKVGTDSTESQPRTETSVTKAGTDSSESQSRAESSVFKAGTDSSESQPRAESSVSKAGTDTTESQPRAKSSVFKAGTDSSESQPRAESSVFKAGTDSTESQSRAETSVSKAGTDSTESQSRAETSASNAWTDSSESQLRAETSVSKAGTDSTESQPRAESSVSKAGTDSSESQPRAETSVTKAGTDSSESQPRAETSVTKAGTDSSKSQPRADSSVSQAGTDSSESQPRAETSVSKARTDSSESQPRAETSVTKAGTDSSESQPRVESSVSKAGTDSSDGKGHIDLATQPFRRYFGILFWDTTDIQWLTRRISKAGSEGSCVPLCVSMHNEWMSVAGKSSLLILYHSMKSDKSLDKLFSTYFESLLCRHDDQSTHTRGYSMSTSIQGTMSTNSKGEAPRSNPGCLCMTSFGVPRTVIFVIVDVKDSESEMRSRWDQAQFSKCELLLFTEEEITYISSSERLQWTNIQRMEDKLKQMCRVIRTGSSSKFNPKRTIGIFSRCGRDHYTWLQTLLRSEVLSSHGQDIRPFYISNSKQEQFREEVSRCKFVILYHTKNHGRVNITDIEDALYTEELEYLHDKLGKKNVLVMIDDLEDSSEKEKERILQSQPSIRRLSKELIIISEGEKVDSTKVEKKLNKLDILIKGADSSNSKYDPQRSINVSEDSATSPHLPSAGQEGYKPDGKQMQAPNRMPKQKHTIGIFSRSGRESYQWLQTLLTSNNFSSHVKEVTPFYISNRNGAQFIEVVRECTFVILYHTKKHGRVNVTDVTDSLYDQELQYMSGVLGKEKVIVIIDDLEHSNSEEHKRILKVQPLIGSLAKELILFSENEKKLINKDYDISQHHWELKHKILKIKELVTQTYTFFNFKL